MKFSSRSTTRRTPSGDLLIRTARHWISWSKAAAANTYGLRNEVLQVVLEESELAEKWSF